jgi:hypothetical protein
MTKNLQRLAGLLAVALLVALAPVASVLAADDRDKKMETTLMGQLSQDSAGGYVLVEQESGEQIRLEGSDELADHVGHQVKVTGKWSDADTEGQKVFQVKKLEHISA